MKIIDFLGQGGYKLRINNLGEDDDYYLTFKQTLINLGVYFEEDNNVKGLSYYSGIAYEIDVENYDALISGGRYDYLVDNIGGVKVDCVGCKIDFDNLVKLLDQYEMFPSFREDVDFYIIPVGEHTFKYAIYVSELIRDIGAVVEIHYKEYDLKRLDDLLDRVDVAYTIVIEEDDISKETLKVRNSLTKERRVVKLKSFIKDLENLEEHHH
jgi:histidyl-tRNA synthetase